MNKIQELENKINAAANAYYNNTSIMDDDEYDALIYELECLDPKNKLLTKVGADPITEEWKKEKHLFPLGSLNKVNSTEEMSKWISEKLLSKEVVVIEKLDGLSLGIEYKNGKAIKGILRGGGSGEGENIFINTLKMQGFIKTIPNFTGVLRGEIILTKQNHKEYFSTYSNPRNAASGICRRLDGDGSKYLTLMFYQVLGQDFKTEKEQLDFLKKINCIVPNYYICKNSNDVSKIWQEYQDNKRDKLDYEIDGLVVCCDDMNFQQSLGETNLRPKGKMAFKFANQFVKTVVKEIEWQVGNSGRITPVCYVEPVSLLGSTIEKASLYNIAYIEKLNINVGSEVLICKAGEIIPRIEKVIKRNEEGNNIEIPEFCPVCEFELEMVGENLTCLNTNNCQAQVIGKLQNWIKELNVLEWGDALLTHLVEEEKVITIADLYKLSIEELATVERMGKKSAKKCYEILHNNMNISLDIFIGALSIAFIGSSSIRQIISAGYDTLEKIQNCSVSMLENVDGIGPTRAQSLKNGLDLNKELIQDLLTQNIKIKEKVIGKLTGKSVCFTGAMETKRAELEKMVTNEGGEIKGSVGKTLSFLVIADTNSTTSKATAARKFGTVLISEQQFLDILK